MIISQNHSENVLAETYFLSCAEASRALKNKDVPKQEKFELLADAMTIGVKVITHQKNKIDELKEKCSEIDILKEKDIEKDKKIERQNKRFTPIIKDCIAKESKSELSDLSFKYNSLKTASIAFKIIGTPLLPVLVGVPLVLVARKVLDPKCVIVGFEKYALEKMPEMVKIQVLREGVDKIISNYHYRISEAEEEYEKATRYLNNGNDPDYHMQEWEQRAWNKADSTLDSRIEYAEWNAYKKIDEMDEFYKAAVKEYYDE